MRLVFLEAVNLKRMVVWDVTSCNLMEVSRRLRGKYYVYVQGRKGGHIK
jgi:hypothetical protein